MISTKAMNNSGYMIFWPMFTLQNMDASKA